MVQPRGARFFLGHRSVSFPDFFRQRALVFLELGSEVLEASQGFDATQSETFRNHFLHVGGDERFDHNRMRCVFFVQNPELEKFL